MEISEFRKNCEDMIQLTRCALNGVKPDAALVQQLDLPSLFHVCQTHLLTACVAYALNSAGVAAPEFEDEKNRSIRKNIIMDTERRRVLAELEKAQIWYMPLKGAIMKDWYPKLGMRQMSDNDILCDPAFRKQVRAIMEQCGFTCVKYDKGNDDTYHKPPVCNFEMHTELFSTSHAFGLHDYYKDIQSKLCRDTDNAFGYHFRSEDFYIYVLAHEYKHYKLGGTGVRSLVDIEIMLRKFGNSLDWEYMKAELQKLRMTAFEKQCRHLARKLFSCEKPLTEAEKRELDYFITSGVYGTQDHRIENDLQKHGGSIWKYLHRRLFPTMDGIQARYPFFYRHKVLLPVLWIWRPIRILVTERKKLLSEIRLLCKKQPH